MASRQETIDDFIYGVWDNNSEDQKYDDIFNHKIYDDLKKKSIEQRRKMTSKNTEGSAGPCPFCDSLFTKNIPMQTRSGDEAITFTSVCGSCKSNWSSK